MNRDAECVAFLQWALPRLRLRWAGFRKVRRQACRRLRARIAALGLDDLVAYRELLERDGAEWQRLDGCCRITISRFYRDRAVFDLLREEVLPELARSAHGRDDRTLRVWSAGCASGEEPYTIAILWRHAIASRVPDLALRLLATDAGPDLLERAHGARYDAGSLRDLPAPLRNAAFADTPEGFVLHEEIRNAVDFQLQDVRDSLPEERFDLILCRNLVFTYFDRALQRELAMAIWEKLLPGGALVLGSQERFPLPLDLEGLAAWPGSGCIYRRTAVRVASGPPIAVGPRGEDRLRPAT